MQTTEEQRQILFAAWEKTDNIKKACRKVGVSRGTFYYWKDRFIAEGYAGLVKLKRNAPHNPYAKDAETVEYIIQLKRDNPEWGKLRIAKEIKAMGITKKLSPNTVRRILQNAGLWNK